MENLVEIWKPIKNYEGLYEVSNFGRVKSLSKWLGNYYRNEKILKQEKEWCGYLRVALSKDSKVKHFKVHRLVAETFIPNTDNLPQVNHKDENKLNNHVENLEWMSAKDNTNYGTGIERRSKSKSKPVLQFDLQGNFIREWKSCAEAGRNGYNEDCIGYCCNNKPKHSTHKGYIWKWKKESY